LGKCSHEDSSLSARVLGSLFIEGRSGGPKNNRTPDGGGTIFFGVFYRKGISKKTKHINKQQIGKKAWERQGGGRHEKEHLRTSRGTSSPGEGTSFRKVGCSSIRDAANELTAVIKSKKGDQREKVARGTGLHSRAGVAFADNLMCSHFQSGGERKAVKNSSRWYGTGGPRQRPRRPATNPEEIDGGMIVKERDWEKAGMVIF